MKNFAGLMKQAQQMQNKMEELRARLEGREADGESGAGMVRVTVNGKGDLRRITIDPKIVDPGDTEMLQDLVLAAYRDARSRIDAISTAEFDKLTGGLGLPPGMKLPF